MSARVPEPERRIVLAVASRLLQYPDDEFTGQLPLLRDAVRGVDLPAGSAEAAIEKLKALGAVLVESEKLEGLR